MTPVVVIADTGVDDAGALLWAATSGNFELVAVIGTFGNCAASQAARNSLAVLEAAGVDVPVYVGATEASGPALPAPPVAVLMGADGLADCGVADPSGAVAGDNGAARLVELARQRPGELTVLSLAPLTTLAQALALEPDLPSLLRQVVVMGGAIEVGGYTSAVAEPNIANDPNAAAAVVAAFGTAAGALPMLVPLDVTAQATISDAELEALAASALAGAEVVERVWAKAWPVLSAETGGAGAAIHDLTAALALGSPELFEWETLPLAVDCAGGPAWGMTVADRRVRLLANLDPDMRAMAEEMLGAGPSRWSIAMSVDVPAYRRAVRVWLEQERA
jgi:purine nucleosidase